jgi:lysophospholipase L1-like esterase
MIDCLIIGDSIAVGTKIVSPTECVAYAKGGYNSYQWNQKWGDNPLDSKIVVISLGTNDHKFLRTEYELRKLREHISADKVIWIMPPCNEYFCKKDINAVVDKIAQEYHDMIINTDKLSTDHIHPTREGYKELANKAGLILAQ